MSVNTLLLTCGTRNTRPANALNSAGSSTEHSSPRACGSRSTGTSANGASNRLASSVLRPSGSVPIGQKKGIHIYMHEKM